MHSGVEVSGGPGGARGAAGGEAAPQAGVSRREAATCHRAAAPAAPAPAQGATEEGHAPQESTAREGSCHTYTGEWDVQGTGARDRCVGQVRGIDVRDRCDGQVRGIDVRDRCEGQVWNRCCTGVDINPGMAIEITKAWVQTYRRTDCCTYRCRYRCGTAVGIDVAQV